MKSNKYLPVEAFVLVSKLPVAEVTRRLADSIEPKRQIRLFKTEKRQNKPYEGLLSGNSFRISRIIDYRNSFLPVITGQISTFLGKTEIAVKMQPDKLVLIFVSLWAGVVALFCLTIVTSGLLQVEKIRHNGVSPWLLLPFGMLVFVYALTMLAFKTESRKSRKFLKQLLEAQEAD